MSTGKAPVSSIPALHAFDARISTWKSYRDRVKFYFQANKITTDDDKKAFFLWSVGDPTYNLLESLISPQSLTDEDVTFASLIKLLDAHYDDTKNIMTSTYDFYSCYQKPGQSFAEWKAELCEKLRHCGFTTSRLSDKPQDRALRDMYVIGIRSQKIRQALLKEEDPDLEKTEKIIHLAERLAEDVRHFGNPVNENDYTVAKLHHQQQQKRHRPPLQQQQPTNGSTTDKKPCDSCGSDKHLRSTCKYRDFICNFCKRTGHLERVCRQKKEGENSTKHITTIFKLDCINQGKQSSTYSSKISLQVNGHHCTFELDTGTFKTIIGMKDWYKLGSPTIRSSKSKLKCYNGNTLKVKGECNVKVKYNNQNYNLSILIVNGATSPLLGLQWINMMQLDLNRIIHGQNPIQRSVQKIYNHSKLQATKQQLKYDIGQLVSTLNRQLNKRPQWQPAIITNKISPMIYEIQLQNGQRHKRHQNQLRPRYSSNIQSSEMDSLPDDLLNIKSQSTAVKSSPPSSRRYPQRNRQPPDRYSP